MSNYTWTLSCEGNCRCSLTIPCDTWEEAQAVAVAEHGWVWGAAICMGRYHNQAFCSPECAKQSLESGNATAAREYPRLLSDWGVVNRNVGHLDPKLEIRAEQLLLWLDTHIPHWELRQTLRDISLNGWGWPMLPWYWCKPSVHGHGVVYLGRPQRPGDKPVDTCRLNVRYSQPERRPRTRCPHDAQENS